jgi:iron complex outermembrane recepter protein
MKTNNFGDRMMSIRRHSIHLSLLALWAGGGAAAADASGDQGVPAPASDSGEISTITVTAQRRSEASQNVPIALQVVTSQQIEKLTATDLSSMNGYVPGLDVGGEQPTQPNFTLRGISVSDFGIGTDSPIGIYEDGVYTGKTGGALLLFNDVQHIEVLKGPQGTLFGRNSAAGAISVVTNQPTQDLSADAKVRFGNYGEQYYEAMLNAPLGPDVAARMTFVDNRSNGWMHDSATGAHYHSNDDWGARAQILWHAPGDTSVRLIWEHEDLDQPPRPAIGIVALPPSPGLPPLPTNSAAWLSPFTAPVLNDVVGARESRTFDAATLRVEHSFGFADFTSISAFRHFNTFNREDQDGTNRLYLYFDDVNSEENKSISQEFTLSGKTGIADWVAGASYYYDDAHQTSQLNLYTDSIDTLLNNTGQAPGGFFGPISQAAAQVGIPVSLLGDTWQENMINHGYSRAGALFGDVIWHVADHWNLTTGVRFTHDEKDFSWYNPLRTATQLDAGLGLLASVGFPIPPAPNFPYQNIEFTTPISTAAPLRMNDSWNDTSPRVVLDYKPLQGLMFYASATRGYEAGGYNALEPGAKYEPETVRNYEFGVKSELLDHRLLLNASVYYYLYSNLQSLNLVSNGNGSLPAYEVTISDQHAKGVDFEARWQATSALRLNVLAAYIDDTYKNYVTPDGTDLSGQATGEPLWSLAAGIDYLWHDVAGGDLDFSLQDAYRGATRCNADSAAQGSCLTIPSFRIGTAENRTDARLGWMSAGKVPVSVALYVNNLFDKQYATGVQTISSSTLGTPFSGITAPRFYGVELGVHF